MGPSSSQLNKGLLGIITLVEKAMISNGSEHLQQPNACPQTPPGM